MDKTLSSKTTCNTNIFTINEVLSFIIPSLVGVILFLLPLNYGDTVNIGVGYLADTFKSSFSEYIPGIMTLIICISTTLSIFALIFKPPFILENDFLKEILYLKPLWLIFRIVGAIFSTLTLLQIGPDFIISKNTGGTLLFDLMPTLATWFLLSGLFLPILLNFGIMDFLGTLIRGIMRPLFLVPGRSAIDAIASWIGSGPVGVVLTNSQLKDGYYNKKEAAIISVCFSLVSLPFATVLADFLQISHLFVPLYLAISISSFIAAIILPRIYPLCKISNDYISDTKINESVPSGTTVLKHAFNTAVKRANSGNSIGEIFIGGFKIVFDVYFTLIPMVMCFGTLSLIIAEYTPIFTIISYPIVFILEALGIPGASQAAPAVLVGFADMFLPSVLVANIDFEITRFVIGALSFTQLIYMTETGAIILKSEIPLNLKDLFIIFIERTIITLPIITLIAHMVI